MSQDSFAQAAAWLDEGLPVVMATVVRIVGSSSQPLGARMMITRDNRFIGMVSGGCVETDVYDAAQAVLDRGEALMLHYKHVENPLIEVGLNCEGKIDVLVEPLTRALLEQLVAPGYHVNVTLCTPGTPSAPEARHGQVAPDQETVGDDLPPAIMQAAFDALHNDWPVTVSAPGGQVALLEPVLPPPTLLIVGGDHAAVPLVRFAKLLGFRTIVSDARPAFATREKHPDADRVIAGWPQDVVEEVGIDERTYVVSLNHEPRFEDALLRALADRPVRYIGAIGKRVRHLERVERLSAQGFDFDRLPRIHTPVGLDIGGKSPEEIALSIVAEIVAVRNGRSGGMLVGTETQESIPGQV